MRLLAPTLLALVPFLLGALAQEQCGRQNNNAECPGGLCCSQWGYCGTSPEYCATGCQSNCKPSLTAEDLSSNSDTTYTTAQAGDVGSIITSAMFENMLKHRSEGNCRGRFYTYNAFITAAKSFQGFGTTGSADQRKREVAAFFAQTSHETTGGWPTAPDGPHAWGYCFTQEQGSPGDYCQPSPQWPCAPGKKYFGRGPIQITWNYNYGQAGKAIGADLLRNPDLVTSDPVIAFKTALWFWMTPQPPKPSSHDVIIGRWQPSPADKAANRLPGFGTITNIINGGLECGKGPDPRVQDRIGFFKRYTGILGVSPGENLDCFNQKPFGR